MSELAQLEVFVRVADTGSFTAAAETLGVSKSFASRQLSALEDRLGARLLNRTTRKISLTDMGQEFYARCAQILEDLQEAELAVAQLQTTPSGTLRLTAPMSFGTKFVAPAISEFLAQHQQLALDLQLTDRAVDLVDEGLDVAVRVGPLADSSLVARKLGNTCAYVCASGAYLESHGRPETPEDLRGHDCLLYSYQRSGPNWRLQSGEQDVTVSIRGRMTANNGEALVDAARRGLGLALLPDFLVGPEIDDGTLQRVLSPWERRTPVWAIYPQGRHLSAKVRLFVDFLVERFRDPPWRCRSAGR